MRLLTDHHPEGYYFDEAAARRVLWFFQQYLVHVKGRWARQPFEPLDWQAEILAMIFGWKRPDGTRQYRKAYIEIPRKNGKSSWGAGIALYLLCADDEDGAEVYSAAGDKKQASIVFEMAKEMAQRSPELSKRIARFRNSLVYHARASRYEVLSSDADLQHGLNPHAVIFDELHVQPNRELWDVMTTAQGARVQPFTIAFTTAGFDRKSICFEQHEYGRQVAEGVIEDPSYFAFLSAADEDDDWTDPAVWTLANPSLGETISLEYLEEECREAQRSPARQNTFRRLHLNQWTRSETRYIDLEAWDETAGKVDLGLLEGATAYGGLDLATTTDIAAFVLVWPAKDEPFRCWPWLWVPEEKVWDRTNRDGVPYQAWVRDGWITATEGNVIDYRVIVRTITELGERYRIPEIAFDRWGSQAIQNELGDAGFKMIQAGQGFPSMSPPTKELEKLVLSKRLHHGGHPVLRWMADNLVVRTDPAGNVKPDKSKSTEKIDGMVALIMALDRAIRKEGAPKLSVYATRGLQSL